jgi:hypothetical protein
MEYNSGYYIASFMVAGACLLGWIITKYFEMNKKVSFKQPKQTKFGFIEVNDDAMFKSDGIYGQTINPVEIPSEMYFLLGPLTFSHYSALFGKIQFDLKTSESLKRQFETECRLITVAAYLFKFSIPRSLLLIDKTTVGYYLHFTKSEPIVQVIMTPPTFLKEAYVPSIKEATFHSLFKVIPNALEICEKSLRGDVFPSKMFLMHELRRNRVAGSPEAIEAVLTLAFGLGGFTVPQSYTNVTPMVLDVIYILNNPNYYSQQAEALEEQRPKLTVVK